MESGTRIDCVFTCNTERVDRTVIQELLSIMAVVVVNVPITGETAVGELCSGKAGQYSIETLTLNGFVQDLIRKKTPQYPAKSGNGTSAEREIVPVSGRNPVLSSSQKRLWFFHIIAPDSPAYNLALKLKVSGTVDAECIFRSLDYLTERHQAFRTVFKKTDGEPEVAVLANSAGNYETVDLREVPDNSAALKSI